MKFPFSQLTKLPLLLGIIIFVPSVYAARSMTVNAGKSSLLGNEDVTITASASGFTDGETIYIKGAFFQSGSSNYFGYTKSGDAWIKNSTSNTSQRAVKIGDWDGTLVVKSDFTDSGYKGEGDYSFKVGYYYGSYSSVNWSSNILSLTINEPDPTPTNTPTSTPVPTATSIPTSTPTLTSTPTPLSTQTPTNTPTLIPTKILSPILTPGESPYQGGNELTVSNSANITVLGIESESPIATETQRSTMSIIFPLSCISLGLALLTAVSVWQAHMNPK